MTNEEEISTQDMIESEKNSLSIITCDMEGRIETFGKGAE